MREYECVMFFLVMFKKLCRNVQKISLDTFGVKSGNT